jgi:hypothetical protein
MYHPHVDDNVWVTVEEEDYDRIFGSDNGFPNPYQITIPGVVVHVSERDTRRYIVSTVFGKHGFEFEALKERK